MRSIAAGKFKAVCFKIMDEVNRTRHPVVITRRNVPIVELVPIKKKKVSLFGYMKGSVEVIGDIMQPIDEKWNADS